MDPIARERLDRQLNRAEPSVKGIAALLGDLPAGASYRTAAEHASCRSEADTASPVPGRMRAAVLLRPGIEIEDGEDGITLPAGAFVVDRGSTVHNPWRHIGTPEAASPLGRSPFPSRPTALFLGTEPDPDLADWVRFTVNELVRRGTEGRIAVPVPTGGLHLTRPCTPTTASVAALVPDVVVTLDPDAHDVAMQGLGDDRSAVIVDLTRDTTAAIELVSWRIGHSMGRIRARIGRGVDVEELADLIRRLCAGPQPMPPRNRDLLEGPMGKVYATNVSPREWNDTMLTVSVLVADSTDRARFAGFADHAGGVGATATVEVVGAEQPPLHTSADIVWLRGLSTNADAIELARERLRNQRVTVLDIAPCDLDFRRANAAGAPVLLAETAALAMAIKTVTTTSARVRDALAALDLRVLVMPTLLTREGIAELRRIRAERQPAANVIGWHTGDATHSDEVQLGAARAALASLLSEDPRLVVTVVGHATRAAGRLASNRRVQVVPGEPDARTVARWSGQLWTVSANAFETSGDLGAPVVAGMLGIPTIVAAQNRAVSEGLVPSRFAVEQPYEADSWLAAARRLGDSGASTASSDTVAGLADALYGSASSTAVLNRWIGWLEYMSPGCLPS